MFHMNAHSAANLPVGSMASLSGVVAGVMFVAGWPAPVALAAALAVGALGVLDNGLTQKNVDSYVREVLGKRPVNLPTSLSASTSSRA